MGMGTLTSIGIGERTNGFSRDFVDFLSGRSDRLSKDNFALTSEDYRSICYELDSLQDKVKHQMGEETSSKLDEAVVRLVTLTIFLSFKAGFSDGVKMIVHSLDD
jgi:hypothetical protein